MIFRPDGACVLCNNYTYILCANCYEAYQIERLAIHDVWTHTLRLTNTIKPTWPIPQGSHKYIWRWKLFLFDTRYSVFYVSCVNYIVWRYTISIAETHRSVCTTLCGIFFMDVRSFQPFIWKISKDVVYVENSTFNCTWVSLWLQTFEIFE